MRDVIRTALDRSDVVILTGGLGPTEDDITKEVTADLMGMPLVEDSHSKKLIDKYLKEYEKTILRDVSQRITINRPWFLREPLFLTIITELLRD